ncbi:MAG: TRAP transporter large permease [bacterium]
MLFLILVVLLLILLIIGLPVAFSLLLTSIILVMVEGTAPMIIVAQRLTNSMNSFPLLAVPLFILAAQVMNESGATEQIFEFANLLVGKITGGLGHVNVLASMLFSGMSGSSVADASGLGLIEIEAMKKANYPLPFAAAITAASSTIGPIIPPSVAMVIYGVISGSSISALFLGGAIPGFLMGFSMMLIVYIIAKKRNIDNLYERPPVNEIIKIILNSIPALFLPVIILGGIWGGIFSPTEAAAVAVAVSALLGFFFYKELSLKDIPKILFESGLTTGTIMFIVAAANLYGWLITVERIPHLMQNFLLGVSQNRIIILLIINFILLIAGMFMEMIAILTITVPVFLPIVTSLGVDPVFFGVLAVLNLMIGLLTPPFGISIYILQRIAKVPFWEIVKEIIPFIIVLITLVIIIVFFPNIVMFLPELILR